MSVRRAIAGSAVVLGVVTGALVVAAPAYAASTCSSGYSCTYGDGEYLTLGHANWGLGFYNEEPDFAGLSYNGFLTFPTVLADNSATSVYNNGNVATSNYYKSANYRGTHFHLSKHTGDAALSNSVGYAPGGFNDSLSSGKFN